MIAAVAASAVFTLAGLFMRASAGFSRLGPSVALAALFVAGAALMSRAAMRNEVSTSTIVCLGLEAVGSLFVGMMLLGEEIRPGKLAGAAIVVVGVAVLRA